LHLASFPANTNAEFRFLEFTIQKGYFQKERFRENYVADGAVLLWVQKLSITPVNFLQC
jgi:hypothetical protein